MHINKNAVDKIKNAELLGYFVFMSSIYLKTDDINQVIDETKHHFQFDKAYVLEKIKMIEKLEVPESYQEIK